MNQFRLGVIACAMLLAQAVGLYGNEDEIRETIKAYADAFNQKDFEKAAAIWSEDASYINRETGEKTVGREAIRADLQVAFAERPGERLMGRIDSIDLITPEVARVQGETTLSSPDVEPQVAGFSGIFVKQDGKWLIRLIEELSAVVPSSSADALSELEWLLGVWEDEADGARVVSRVQWSPNQAFMIRSTFVESDGLFVRQGTQVIGWDPRSLQIRSWTFNSDGTFGDELWSKNGEAWLIKASQTLAEGQAASGTFVMTPIDESTISVRLIGHEIEGEPQLATQPILMRRVEVQEAGSGSQSDAAPSAGAAGAVR